MAYSQNLLNQKLNGKWVIDLSSVRGDERGVGRDREYDPRVLLQIDSISNGHWPQRPLPATSGVLKGVKRQRSDIIFKMPDGDYAIERLSENLSTAQQEQRALATMNIPAYQGSMGGENAMLIAVYNALFDSIRNPVRKYHINGTDVFHEDVGKLDTQVILKIIGEFMLGWTGPVKCNPGLGMAGQVQEYIDMMDGTDDTYKKRQYAWAAAACAAAGRYSISSADAQRIAAAKFDTGVMEVDPPEPVVGGVQDEPAAPFTYDAKYNGEDKKDGEDENDGEDEKAKEAKKVEDEKAKEAKKVAENAQKVLAKGIADSAARETIIRGIKGSATRRKVNLQLYTPEALYKMYTKAHDGGIPTNGHDVITWAVDTVLSEKKPRTRSSNRKKT